MRVAMGAFDVSIKRLQDRGEPLPLHWSEVPSYSYPVGSVDPATLGAEDAGWLFFKGTLDLETEDRESRIEAGHAWAAIKANGVRLKLDYMVLENDETDGARTLQEVDLTGLTLEPTAAGSNAIRRKATEDERELRRESDRLQVEMVLGCPLDEFIARNAPEPAEQRGPTSTELRAKAAELGVSLPATGFESTRDEWEGRMVSLLGGSR
jgi:hypothetical protein